MVQRERVTIHTKISVCRSGTSPSVHSHFQHITQHIIHNSIQSLESHFQGAVFHCEDKHASSLRIFTIRPSTTHFLIQQFSAQLTNTRFYFGGQIWKILPMGHWQRPSTSLRLHPSQNKEETLLKWPSNHLLRGFTFQTHVEHLGKDDFPTHSGGVSTAFCHGRCRPLPFHSTSGS